MDKIFCASDVGFGILEQGVAWMVECFVRCGNTFLGVV
jgi:hypothetical protein